MERTSRQPRDASGDTSTVAGADEGKVRPRVDGAEIAATDGESADALVGYIRERQRDKDGAGEWMAFAFMDYDRKAREAERRRIAALTLPLVEGLTTMVASDVAFFEDEPHALAIMQVRAAAAQAAIPQWRHPGSRDRQTPRLVAERRGAAVPAGASVWLKAKDIQELLGCCRSQSYEHLHRAAGGRACRVRLDAWERYAAVTFDCASTRESKCTLSPASGLVASSESSTRESTSTASASSAPPGPRTWKRRGGSLLSGNVRPPRIREIIPKARQRSSKP